MADTIIQLPYTGTTSGDLLDATVLTVGANSVKRERMVISNDASTSVAVVTSSGTLTISGLVALSSGTVTLSSAPTVNVSSGVITLSSNPVAGQVVSLSSGTVTLSSDPTVVSASSGLVQVLQSTGVWAVVVTSGTVTLSSAIAISSGTITLSSATSLSSGTVTLSSDPTVVSASSGGVQVYTTGTYLVNATSTSGLLTDITRGVSLVFFNIRATSSGLTSLVAASGSNKVKLISYVLVSNSTQDLAFYSSNTALGASSSAPMVLSSYSGISAVGDRTSWIMETSAAGNLQIYLGNAGIVAGHGSYIYEV